MGVVRVCKWNQKSLHGQFCQVTFLWNKSHICKRVSFQANMKVYQHSADCFKTKKRKRKMMDCTFTLKLNSLSSVFVLFYSAFTRSITLRHCTTSIHSKGSGKKVSEWQKLWFGVTQEWIRGARGQIDDTCNLKHVCQPQSASTCYFFNQIKGVHFKTLRYRQLLSLKVLCNC